MPAAHRSSHVATAVAMLVASVVVHAVMWPVGDRVLGLQWRTAPLPSTGGAMEVALLTLDGEEEEEPDPDELPPEERPEPPGKLVQLDRILDERAPDDTEHVSEFDSRVDHETRAPNRPAVPDAPATQRGDSPDARSDRSSNDPKTDPTKALPLLPQHGQGSAGDGRQADADSAVAEDERGSLPSNPGAIAKLSPQGMRGSKVLRDTFGSPGTHDDLDGIDEGNENILNSKRWKYASFFNRVRNSVAQHWHPEVVHASRDPDGRINGTRTRKTRLVIRLNPDGSLKGIVMDLSSEVDYLDEEAIRAVRTAAPFANPPAGLVDPRSGLIEFGFAFIFEIEGGRRIFKYRG